MKALIVDDEDPARVRLKRLLEKHADIEILGEAADGISALEEIERLKPDVVFLDIEMPELDGIGVADAIKGSGPAVIFVTAYNEHALKAFEVSALDYLVKPIVEARLDIAVEKIRKQKNSRWQAQNFSQLMAAVTNKGLARRLAVRCGSKFIVFDPAKISAILARDHYAAIIVDGKELLADDSLDTLAGRFNSQQFTRIHRSALINIDYLKELEREGDRKYTAILNDPGKTRVPVSRERLQDLKELLGIT